jgi:hypothetical protein
MGRGKELTEGEQYTAKMLKKDNKSVAEIARTLGRSATSVKSCLKRLELAADTAYLERPNCRRRRIIDERIKRRVLREIKTDASLRRLSKRYIAKEISSNIPKAFSAATLVRTLKENGFPERNRRKRLKWARDHKDFKGDWWRILWTDESSVSTDSYGEVRVWCQKDELYSPECTQATVKSGRKSIMVWGCIDGQGTNHLVHCSSHINGREYGNLVLDVIYPTIVMSEKCDFPRGQCAYPQVQDRLTTHARARNRNLGVAATIAGSQSYRERVERSEALDSSEQETANGEGATGSRRVCVGSNRAGSSSEFIYGACSLYSSTNMNTLNC